MGDTWQLTANVPLDMGLLYTNNRLNKSSNFDDELYVLCQVQATTAVATNEWAPGVAVRPWPVSSILTTCMILEDTGHVNRPITSPLFR
jgi:hypothetical protein